MHPGVCLWKVLGVNAPTAVPRLSQGYALACASLDLSSPSDCQARYLMQQKASWPAVARCPWMRL